MVKTIARRRYVSEVGKQVILGDVRLVQAGTRCGVTRSRAPLENHCRLRAGRA